MIAGGESRKSLDRLDLARRVRLDSRLTQEGDLSREIERGRATPSFATTSIRSGEREHVGSDRSVGSRHRRCTSRRREDRSRPAARYNRAREDGGPPGHRRGQGSRHPAARAAAGTSPLWLVVRRDSGFASPARVLALLDRRPARWDEGVHRGNRRVRCFRRTCTGGPAHSRRYRSAGGRRGLPRDPWRRSAPRRACVARAGGSYAARFADRSEQP
jgi:hypothetical protein